MLVGELTRNVSVSLKDRVEEILVQGHMHDRRVCLLEMGDYCVIDGIVVSCLFVFFWWIWMVTPKLGKKNHLMNEDRLERIIGVRKNEHSLSVAGHFVTTFLPV